MTAQSLRLLFLELGRADVLCAQTIQESAETLAREIPHASLLFIEHAAHFTPLEQAAQVTAALRRWMEQAAAT